VQFLGLVGRERRHTEAVQADPQLLRTFEQLLQLGASPLNSCTEKVNVAMFVPKSEIEVATYEVPDEGLIHPEEVCSHRKACNFFSFASLSCTVLLIVSQATQEVPDSGEVCPNNHPLEFKVLAYLKPTFACTECSAECNRYVLESCNRCRRSS
jgi:hypothetical protein